MYRKCDTVLACVLGATFLYTYQMASIHMSTTSPHPVTHLSITLIVHFGVVSLNYK